MSDKRKAEMLRLREIGLTLRSIGRRYGISRQRVHQILGPTGTITQMIERKEEARLKSSTTKA